MNNSKKRVLAWGLVLGLLSMAAGIWVQQKFAPNAGLGAGSQIDSGTAHAFMALAIEPVETPVHPGFKAAMRVANPGLSSIGSSKRKVTIVNFWATWCPPCLEEMPALSQLALKTPSAQFIGIGVDSESKVREYLTKTPISFPVTASGANAIDWAKTLGNQQGGLPFTAFFGPSGQLMKIVSGPLDLQTLPDLITQLELGK